MSAGGFAEYVVVRERQVYPLPDNISMQQGALIEPFSIAVHAIEKANLYPGATAAIVGAGMIGLACLQLAVHAGAAMTCISEPILTKRQHAAKLGADYVIDPEKDSLLDSIQQHTDKRGVDSFIDAVGLPREIETGFHALKNDGTLVVVGVAPVNSEIRLNPFLIYAKEANIRGVNWSPYSFHKTISLLPKLEVSELISEVLPLEEFARAFDICRSGDTIKVLLKIGA